MTADPSVSPGVAVEATSSAESQPLPRWREHPERVAWIVILLSFAIFLVLARGIPLTLQALYQSTTLKQSLSFQTTVGTALLYPPRSDQPIALTDGRDGISEGSRLVTTGAATQGVLGFPVNSQSDDLMGTILLYPSTTLDIVKSRRPYFAGSDHPYLVRIRLQAGQVRLFTRSPLDRPVEVHVETPHGEALLGAGNYAFIVNAESSEVVVKQGAARLFQDGQETVEIQPGMRAWMQADGKTMPPVPAEHNLLRGSAFDSPLGEEWESYTPPHIMPGAVDFREQEGRRVARFFFRGPNDIHTEVGIRQVVNQDVHSYDSLVVKLDVKLIWQTLAGAGEKSSEFPLRVEITYTDIYGKTNLKWGYGFYNMDPKPGYPLFGGKQIELFSWYTYESANLMEELKDTPPARINSIRLYASGHNYEALASDLELIVK